MMANSAWLKYKPIPLLWERHYPLLFGFGISVLTLCFAPELGAFFTQKKWVFANIYTSIFTLESTLTAFLLTFYGVIVTAPTGFLRRIQGTPSFKAYLNYVRVALVSGFWAAVISVPFMIVAPELSQSGDGSTIAISLWLGLSVFVLAAFFRILSAFFLLLDGEVPDAQRGEE